MSNEEKLIQYTNRIEAIKKIKISSEAELKMLETQYQEKEQELKDLGVTDLDNLPSFLQNLGQEITTAEQKIENVLSDIETKLTIKK
jgi:flagellar biosynthesis chaperone FliJ